ncbi:branched-chain amino acid transferase [Rubrobacter tropicus]|uniref:Branched-chain amino acid transferase n=2 Tax=Rubrobacter tropicus TaxID=2653851 RepID=A0A6G8QET1_9ACTN|nr:branched-chain amino acid transferase [Rubrobacter tropicus]
MKRGTSRSGDRGAYAEGAAFVEGEFVPVDEARIPILDWGFLRSDATYDVAHVWRGSFFRLEDHLDRFERGVAKLRLRLPFGRDRIREILVECVRLSGLRDAYAEVICTRGIPKPGSRDPRDCENRFYAFVVPFVWISTPDKQTQGLHATISRVERIPPGSVDPTVKNYHWLDLQAGLLDAYDRGGETAILVDENDNVVEGPGFNVFAVKDGAIATPDGGVLEGVTRRTVMELAADLNVRLERRPVPAEELRRADEAFVTSTAGGVMPVTAVDGSPLGDGRPGPVTLRLRGAYWGLHEDPRFSLPVRYD